MPPNGSGSSRQVALDYHHPAGASKSPQDEKNVTPELGESSWVTSCTWRKNEKASIALDFCRIADAILRGQNISPEDAAAIKKPAMDYIEGWYEGNAARMESALHPELAKRIVIVDVSTGRSRLDSMSAMTLVQRTRAGGGTKVPKEKQQKDITILDRFNNAAVVKVIASEWIDYLEEAKVNGEWKIINVLWEVKPDSELAMRIK